MPANRLGKGRAFRWSERSKLSGLEVGDMRVVVRFLLLPKKLGGEWRWLGFECIAQEFRRSRAQGGGGWCDVGWDP